MKKVAAGLLLLILSACASGVPAEFSGTSKRVAILSFAGHKLNALENVKPSDKSFAEAVEKYRSANAMWESTVTEKDFDISPMRTWQHDIADWGIDDFIVSKATSVLTSTHQIVPFQWDPADYGEPGTYGFWSKKIRKRSARSFVGRRDFRLQRI
jgi:hypothetical protein